MGDRDVAAVTSIPFPERYSLRGDRRLKGEDPSVTDTSIAGLLKEPADRAEPRPSSFKEFAESLGDAKQCLIASASVPVKPHAGTQAVVIGKGGLG